MESAPVIGSEPGSDRIPHPGPWLALGRRPVQRNASASRPNRISEVTALLRINEIKTAGAGINFPGHLRRLVRPVGPGQASAAAQVGWKAHLDGI